MKLNTDEGTAGENGRRSGLGAKSIRGSRIDLYAQFEPGYRGKDGRRSGLDLRLQEPIWEHSLNLDTEEGTAGEVNWKQSRSEAPRVDLGVQFESGYRERHGRISGLDARSI